MTEKDGMPERVWVAPATGSRGIILSNEDGSRYGYVHIEETEYIRADLATARLAAVEAERDRLRLKLAPRGPCANCGKPVHGCDGFLRDKAGWHHPACGAVEVCAKVAEDFDPSSADGYAIPTWGEGVAEGAAHAKHGIAAAIRALASLPSADNLPETGKD